MLLKSLNAMTGCGRWPLLALLFATVAACGGGGSSVPAPPASPLSVDISSITRSAAVNELTPAVVINATIDNAYANAILSARYSKHGIASLTGQFTTATTVSITIQLDAPGDKAPGIYQDQVLLRLCTDSGCSQVVTGSDVTVPVTYTITPPAAGNVPALHVGSMSVLDYLIQGLPTSPSRPYMGVTLPFTIANVGTPAHISVTGYSTSGINTVSSPLFADPQSNNALQVFFKLPSAVGLGTYHDTITLTACLDQACVNPVIGSPFTIPVDYTVTNTFTASGSSGYVWNPVQIDPQYIAWNATSQRLIGITSWATQPNPQSLISIDPVTLLVDWIFPLGNPPTSIAVSEDGLYAYVGLSGSPHSVVEKIRLSDHAVIASVAVTDNSSIDEIHPMPGFADMIAVASHVNYTERSVRLLDMAVGSTSAYLITQNLSGSQLSLAWGGSANVLYVYDVADDKLYTFHPTGTQLGIPVVLDVDLNGTQSAYSRIVYGQGMLIESHGAIFNIANQQITARLQLPLGFGSTSSNPDMSVAEVDATNHRLYFRYSIGGYATLSAFDLQTLQMTGTMLTNNGPLLGSLVRWGGNGLAYTTDAGFVGIMTGAFVVP